MLSLVLISLLLGQVICYVHATSTPLVITTQRGFNDSWYFKANEMLCVKRNLTASRIDTLVGGTWYMEIKTEGYVDVYDENGAGIRLKIFLNSTKYPKAKIYSDNLNEHYEPPSLKSASNHPHQCVDTTNGYDIAHYDWDGINFLQAPGSYAWHVDYDHPNNVDDSGASGTYYNVPQNEGEATTLHGDGKYHHHIPSWVIDDMIEAGSTIRLIGQIGAFIAILLGLPELVVSKIVAAVAALVACIIAIVGMTIQVFAQSVLKTELGDGWTWTWGHGQWWVFAYWWQSFGRWRDWGFFWYVVVLYSWPPPQDNVLTYAIAGGKRK